eukprot:528784-Lingulodinium_polyedra.AAC.1
MRQSGHRGRSHEAKRRRSHSVCSVCPQIGQRICSCAPSSGPRQMPQPAASGAGWVSRAVDGAAPWARCMSCTWEASS